MVAISRLRSGMKLLQEVLHAADQANNTDGKVGRGELLGILKAEGYRRGESVFDAPTALHASARRLAKRTAPSVATVNKAGAQVLKELEKAAARDGNAKQLSPDEFQKLSPTAKAAVRFAEQYGDKTIDAMFF